MTQAATYNAELHQHLFSSLQADLLDDQKNFPLKKPLIAHYTSIAVIDEILRGKTLWLSNPLYMNDLQEMRFGLQESLMPFLFHQGIADACGTKERHTALCSAYQQFHANFQANDAFDVYVACFSEHDVDDYDGRLTMWRGYGANGGGAALVFNTAKLPELLNSALVLTRVEYATDSQRKEWINNKLNEFADLLRKTVIATTDLYLAAYALFDRFLLFSICSKHRAFDDEREWRIIYMKHRRPDEKIQKMLGYAVTPAGIQPKLKYAIEGPALHDGRRPLSLSDIVDRIILGPTANESMAVRAMQRMLEINGLSALAGRVSPSSIPYRRT